MPHQYRRIAGFTLLLIAVVVGGSMYWQYTERQLWGYAPLFFYLTLYGGTLLLLTYRADGTTRTNNRLSLVSGMLLGFGFPGILPVPFLLLVAFVPLLLLQQQLAEQKAGYGRVFAHGFSTFLLYNILATYWVTNTSLGAGLFAMLANTLLMCLPWLAFHWTSRQSPKVAYLAFAACWVTFEYFHFNWELNWPWLTLGNGFAQWPSLVQWYEVTGVLGGSAWVLGCNYLAFKLYTNRYGWFRADPQVTIPPPAAGANLSSKQNAGQASTNTASVANKAPASAPQKRYLPLITALVVLVPMAGSLIRYATYTPGNVGTITVGSIQPNFEPHFEKFANNQGAQLDTFLRLSKAALAAGPLDYLVYPETSFSQVNEDDPVAAPPFQILRDELQGTGLKYLVSGFDGYHIFGPNEPLTPAVRYVRNGTLALEALNAAVQIDFSNGEVQTYRKGVFVPGAESFPFRKALFFMEGFVNSLGGTVAGRGTQARRLPLTSPDAKIAPVICYESVFGEYFTDYIKEGAQAIFVMTNDGWWDNTGGHRQHLWLSSLRAIETRRDVVRSANTGISAFIDQRGKIRSRTAYDEATYLNGVMVLNDATTLYVRWGDIIARIAMLLAGMAILGNLTRSLRNRTTSAGR